MFVILQYLMFYNFHLWIGRNLQWIFNLYPKHCAFNHESAVIPSCVCICLLPRCRHERGSSWSSQDGRFSFRSHVHELSVHYALLAGIERSFSSFAEITASLGRTSRPTRVSSRHCVLEQECARREWRVGWQYSARLSAAVGAS